MGAGLRYHFYVGESGELRAYELQLLVSEESCPYVLVWKVTPFWPNDGWSSVHEASLDPQRMIAIGRDAAAGHLANHGRTLPDEANLRSMLSSGEPPVPEETLRRARLESEGLASRDPVKSPVRITLKSTGGLAGRFDLTLLRDGTCQLWDVPAMVSVLDDPAAFEPRICRIRHGEFDHVARLIAESGFYSITRQPEPSRVADAPEFSLMVEGEDHIKHISCLSIPEDPRIAEVLDRCGAAVADYARSFDWDGMKSTEPISDPFAVRLGEGGGMGSGEWFLDLVRDGESTWLQVSGSVVRRERHLVTRLTREDWRRLNRAIEVAGFYTITKRPDWGGIGTDLNTYEMLVESDSRLKRLECYGLRPLPNDTPIPAEVLSLDATWSAVYDFAQSLQWVHAGQGAPGADLREG